LSFIHFLKKKRTLQRNCHKIRVQNISWRSFSLYVRLLAFLPALLITYIRHICFYRFIKNIAFWDVTPYILPDIYRCFGVTCCVHFQGWTANYSIIARSFIGSKKNPSLNKRQFYCLCNFLLHFRKIRRDFIMSWKRNGWSLLRNNDFINKMITIIKDAISDLFSVNTEQQNEKAERLRRGARWLFEPATSRLKATSRWITGTLYLCLTASVV
jgi:hypothetical protein